MKLNIGCGVNKLNGFVNIDKYAVCEPDLLMDAEVLPWPIGDNEVDEVIFNHSLEHMGGDPNVFLGIIKDLYRVCKPNALIHINVPHPRHDYFISDPTHVRAITPELLYLFSKKANYEWKATGAANSPLAIYLDVDFEVTRVEQIIDGEYMKKYQSKEISDEDLYRLVRERCNIVSELKIQMVALK